MPAAVEIATVVVDRAAPVPPADPQGLFRLTAS